MGCLISKKGHYKVESVNCSYVKYAKNARGSYTLDHFRA